MSIIILNGASSSGKSSIAKELQALLPEQYLHIGIDTFISMMPERTNNFTQSNVASEGFYFQSIEIHGSFQQQVQSGQYGQRVNHAYHSTVKHLNDLGLNIIVDDVMNGRLEQTQWTKALGESEAIFIAVLCQENELIRREKSRPDRMQGSALEQAHRVHQGVQYDFIVDSSALTPTECAQRIVNALSGLEKPLVNKLVVTDSLLPNLNINNSD